ncbi:MAG: serine--tRNA ligase [Candidatus Levybacteria bacterium RBG_16_35_6]|nr:MAG: serine--tRNA ligase [Candidatus Levybacteria bacterium RBG_16_35_6]
MLDLKFIRENPKKVLDAALNKGIKIDIDSLLKLDEEKRNLGVEVQKLQEERNKAARERDIEKGKKIKNELEGKEKKFSEFSEQLENSLSKLPNLPKPDVKIGKDESENEVLRKEGAPREFNFTPKDHLTIGENLTIIDVKRAAKISGTRFYYLKNEGVLLEFALRQLAFDFLTKEGFVPVLPPVLIKEEVMRGLGYMENGGDEDMFVLDKDKLVLVGTSEQSIVPMFKDEILDEIKLPQRFVGFSTCFRREAGSYGKDTRGIFRVHQFDKVEIVSYVKMGEDDKEHEYLLSLEEKLLGLLNIPYQVVKMCTGDLGFPAARKYDLEGWFPSEKRYRELTSTSTTTDFQSRRLNIRYRERAETKFVNILNGTAFSSRPIAAILENYQQEDGSVLIPEVLQKYIGRDKIVSKK